MLQKNGGREGKHTTRNVLKQLMVYMMNMAESAMNRFRCMLNNCAMGNCQSLHAYANPQNGYAQTGF